MPEDDIYSKLKPAPPTPEKEICSCQSQFPFVLCYSISANPIRCLACNLEVRPENLPFETQLIDEIASWNGFYRCFFDLWLDSGEFESWARQQLLNPQSPANQRAHQLCLQISELRKCYFWWFQDKNSDDLNLFATCPRCHCPFAEKFGRLICEQCSVLVTH